MTRKAFNSSNRSTIFGVILGLLLILAGLQLADVGEWFYAIVVVVTGALLILAVGTDYDYEEEARKQLLESMLDKWDSGLTNDDRLRLEDLRRRDKH